MTTCLLRGKTRTNGTFDGTTLAKEKYGLVPLFLRVRSDDRNISPSYMYTPEERGHLLRTVSS